VFYFLFKRNRRESNVRVILFYIIYCILNEAISFYLQVVVHTREVTILFPIFTVVEFTFFSVFLFTIFSEKKTRWAILSVWAAFMLFAFIDYFVLSKSQEFDSFTSGIESIVIILLCIYYLYRQLKGSTNFTIYSTFNFWVVITFLIYFCGTFFLYLFAESMRESPTFQIQYFVINTSFNILKNVLLCLAMTMRLNSTVNQQKSLIPDLDDDLFIHNKINSLN
jgi:hypothetical protein